MTFMKPQYTMNSLSTIGERTHPVPLQTPEVAHYVRFVKDEEKLGRMLEIAGAVGIEAESITDPEVAGEAYAAQAHAELARRLSYSDEENQSRPNPVFFRETAKKRVASGDTMVLFTATGLQAMRPFIDEYNRRFGHNAH